MDARGAEWRRERHKRGEGPAKDCGSNQLNIRLDSNSGGPKHARGNEGVRCWELGRALQVRPEGWGNTGGARGVERTENTFDKSATPTREMSKLSG